ncbi:hypothetical protein C0J52_00505 [Blattella germanica]|nr:hypothetical protein C0J52_00505 [Blattella germanica]
MEGRHCVDYCYKQCREVNKGTSRLRKNCSQTTATVTALIRVPIMWIRSHKINPTLNNDFPINYHIHWNRMRQRLPNYVRNVIIRNVQDQRHKVTCDRYLNFSINDNIQNITWNIMSGLSKCQYPFYTRMKVHFKQVTNLFQHFTDFNITHFMIEVFPSCEEIFARCYWLGQRVNCCDVFDLQRTEAGFCYSFNSLTSEKTKHWSVFIISILYPHAHQLLRELSAVQVSSCKGCEPRRNIASGTTTGLEVYLKFSNPDDSLGLGQRDKNGFRKLHET